MERALEERLFNIVKSALNPLELRINQKFTDFSDRFDKKFSVIDEKFDAIDEKFDAIDEKFDAIDEKFSKRFDEQDLEIRRIGIMLEKSDSDREFMLEVLQPISEKILSMDALSKNVNCNKKDIDVTQQALKSHVSDKSRHLSQ